MVELLSNENYSYVKLLHMLSKALWYIRNHAKKEAEEAEHGLSVEMYNEIEQDLEKNIEKIRSAIEGLSKENKFR